jgi:uncharacterized protein YbjT (DUF2867 family)
MDAPVATIMVLGASGLIGEAVVSLLAREGFAVTPVARRFTAAQRTAFADMAVETPIVDLGVDDLARLISDSKADLVVNCIGVLQDSVQRGRAKDVHGGFAERLVAAIASNAGPCMLVHLSVPGRDEDDRTEFSRTKRQAERIITAGPAPFVILRPGFVVADAAYGGSALIRALASLPLDLPRQKTSRPFAATDVADIARTVAVVARRWQAGERQWNAVWDVMERQPSTFGEVVTIFRRHLGGPATTLRLPPWAMGLGAKAGDIAACLGWSPPIRSTALAEMQRGVEGDPEPWIATTGIQPVTLEKMLARRPATLQDKWFARLYLVKPLIFGSLAAFWMLSGLIALTVAFDAATAILTERGFALLAAQAVTVVSSLADILIGVMIALRRTSRTGLLAGIALSLLYMASAALITPALWIEPLGALVKTGPAIVLMVVALAILPER